MLLVIAIIVALFILTGKGIGFLVGSAFDLLWLLVVILLIVWVWDLIKNNPRLRP